VNKRAQKKRERKNKHFSEWVQHTWCKNFKGKCRCGKKHHGGEGGISQHDTPRKCRGGGVNFSFTRDHFLPSIFELPDFSAREKDKRTRIKKEKLKDRERDAEEGEGERRVVARVVKAHGQREREREREYFI